mmetsp:Transcript_8260/g.27478  ORF Transcript_8260/g.27478 Transcript_8260/m.27478 type:complete len:353 (-) Transcript_8260:9-1067(-)
MKRLNIDVSYPIPVAVVLRTVAGSCCGSPTRKSCRHPCWSGTKVEGSTACAASSITTTSNPRDILENTELPLYESVEHTMAASSRICARTRSRSVTPSAPLAPLFWFVCAKRCSISASMLTGRTEWWMLTPTRTTVGEYGSPFSSRMPAVMIRCTISSRALLDGAHTSTCARRWFRDPSFIGAVMIASLLVCGVVPTPIPLLSGRTASRAFAASGFIHGDALSHSRFWSASLSGTRPPPAPPRSSSPPRTRSRRSAPPPPAGTACRMTDKSARIVLVLPVPGGPWMSTIGSFSSPCWSACTCERLYVLASELKSFSGVRHGVPPGSRWRCIAERITSRNGSVCAEWIASHSR